MKRVLETIALFAAVGALLMTAPAFAVTGGRYTGQTSQLTGADTPLEFSLQVGKIAHRAGLYVTRVEYQADYTGEGTACAAHFDGLVNGVALGSRGTTFKGIKINHNSFSAHGILLAHLDHLSISGRFSGKTLSGSLTESLKSVQGLVCNTGNVTFTASKG
jgi:hypothetical protein